MNQKSYILQKLNEYEKYIGKERKASTPLNPDFQELLLDAEHSYEFEADFPYRNMVGSLNYMMIGTRLDIAAALSIVSKFCDNPKKIHCDMVRRIYWYLRGNLNLGLKFRKRGTPLVLEGYCDSSFANLENYCVYIRWNSNFVDGEQTKTCCDLIK
jgi:hypothetical protein